MVLSILLACEVQAKPISKQTAVVAASGETTLTARSSKFDVKVSVRTRSVEGGDHFGLPGGYVERSHVEGVDIVVGGNLIWLNRSVFCDLFDVHLAELRLEGGKGILAFEGGDASESFWVKIEFDAKQVKRRLVGSGMTPGKASIVTSYQMSVLEDE
jgi:hypothetical protein